MNTDGHKWKRRSLIALLVAAVLAACAVWYLRGRNSPPITAIGGRPFTNFVAIETPFYLQRDDEWKNETIRSGEALEARQPALAKVFINHVIPHWVLVVGKEGTQYLMRDPLNEKKTLTGLSSYGSDIYGVRIIAPTAQ